MNHEYLLLRDEIESFKSNQENSDNLHSLNSKYLLDLDNSKEQIDYLIEKLHNSDQNIFMYEEKVMKLSTELLSLNGDLQEKNEMINNLTEQKIALEKDLDECKLVKEKLSSDYDNLNIEFIESIDFNKNIKTKLTDSQKKVSELKATHEKCLNDHTNLKNQIVEIKSESDKYKNESESIFAESLSMSCEIARLNEIVEQSTTSRKLNSSSEDLESQLENLLVCIDMPSVLSRRHDEFLLEYQHLSKSYNIEAKCINSNTSFVDTEVLLDHIINLGVLELMIFETKRKYKDKFNIKILRRSIANHYIDEYILVTE